MKKYSKFYFLLFFVSTIISCSSHAQPINLVTNGASDYKIIIPIEASTLEQKSARVLQTYIQQISGCELKIEPENTKHIQPAIYIGHTILGLKVRANNLRPESYLLQTQGKYLFIKGGSGKGLIYGVYGFLETYLGCRKITADAPIVPPAKTITIPGNIKDEYEVPFLYREVYYPASHNAEYLEWNKLHQFEDLWGLWGHSYDKLVPAKTWFKTHPEYYALVKGKRQPTQLCLSNEEVFKQVVAQLTTKIADNPDAIYWSVSPNDDIGYCECALCKAIDDKEGGPQGSLITFVNRVAKTFPDKMITTLAYGYTHKAPLNIKPAKNVFIFLSNIDAYRDNTLAEDGSATGFRNDLKDWGALTPNIFIWDYVTQFTSYLAPFPNFQTLQANIQYFKDNGVKGVFEQGSGDTYGEFAELRSYLLAKLLWDTKADIKALTTQFLKDFYGDKAAKFIQQYIDLLQTNMKTSKRKLDIYGNPVNEYNTWLSPELIHKYDQLFDLAESVTEGEPLYLARVVSCRLSLEYTVLQQARFFGIEKHGIFMTDDNEKWVLRPKIKERVATFTENCKKAGVTELSEGGLNPDQYQAEWDTIFAKGVTPTKAVDATLMFKYPYSKDYPAKGNRTLVDGNPGYHDFSYNWLCFYNTPMVVTMDLGKPITFSTIKMHFLDDPRHWIFLPESITIEISKDGKNYTTITDIKTPPQEEHYENTIKEYSTPVNLKKGETIRYIKISAYNLPSLPAWRKRDKKQPMIACDEIFVW